MAAAGFEQRPAPNSRFRLYFREPFAAMVEVATGQVGSVMVMTGRGPAAIHWQDGEVILSGRGFVEPLPPGMLEQSRAFRSELNALLRSSSDG